ncbi:Haptoglobin [Dissostichus eleginoides]|uniref:Haptoglobin n=1 Tax=Dissostichus eleginoides TaxID=100907 RepID=A0AAD9F9L9_DISEL|nr:Haptoglobin [Dissostichus eleginoides]
MWFSQTVLLLATCACLADEVLTEEMNQPLSASRIASPRSRRMIGGTLAPHVPWQVMVYIADKMLDGGSAGGALISDRWILTTGRNLFVRKSRQETQGKDPVIPKVYLGIHGRIQAVASNEVAVEKIVLHPGFQNSSDWENDLALIQLKKPVLMSDKVTPIPLPERGQDLADTLGGTGVITGWGWGTTFTLATSLKHLVVPLANQMRGALVVTDAATGDIYAAGILSFDKSCQVSNAVYMKISSYLPWIHSVIRGDTEKSSALRSAAMTKMYSWQQ